MPELWIVLYILLLVGAAGLGRHLGRNSKALHPPEAEAALACQSDCRARLLTYDPATEKFVGQDSKEFKDCTQRCAATYQAALEMKACGARYPDRTSPEYIACVRATLNQLEASRRTST